MCRWRVRSVVILRSDGCFACFRAIPHVLTCEPPVRFVFSHPFLLVLFAGYRTPASFLVSTVPAPFITSISPASAAPASTLTVIGGNFFALGPCQATYNPPAAFPIDATSCNVTSTSVVVLTLATAPPAAAMRLVSFKVFFLPSGDPLAQE
jgi:hypothetical protein